MPAGASARTHAVKVRKQIVGVFGCVFLSKFVPKGRKAENFPEGPAHCTFVTHAAQAGVASASRAGTSGLTASATAVETPEAIAGPRSAMAAARAGSAGWQAGSSMVVVWWCW